MASYSIPSLSYDYSAHSPPSTSFPEYLYSTPGRESSDQYPPLPLSSSSDVEPEPESVPLAGARARPATSADFRGEGQGFELVGFRSGNTKLGEAEEDGMMFKSGRTEGGNKRKSGRNCWSACTGIRQLFFLGMVFLQTCAVLVFIALIYETISNAIGDESAIKSALKDQPRLEIVATYVSLFIYAVVFEIAITLEALLQQNIIQLTLIIPLQICLIIYSSFLPSQLHTALYETAADTPTSQLHVKVYGFAILGVIGVATVGMAGGVWWLTEVFGWAAINAVSADLKINRMYSRYQLFLCLLEFDMFFFIGFAIQFLVLVSGSPLAEKIVTIAAIPVILVVLLLAGVSVRYENKTGVIGFLGMLVAGMGYFGYKLFRIYTQESRYSSVKTTLTIFSGISILLLVSTFVVSITCMRNFGKGLKDKIPPYWSTRDPEGRREGERWSIED